jgi:hypothetical protein
MDTIEVSLKGRTFRLPSLTVRGRTLVLTGKYLKTAAVRDEAVVEGSLVDEPEEFIAALRNGMPRADVLTFVQKIPLTTPMFKHPFEWDNVASLKLTTYEDWLKKIKDKGRNMIRKAQKSGVITRLVGFDDHFVRQVMDIYNETPMRQGRKFWHYGKDFETVKRELSTYLERSHFIGAFLGEELIGFMKMVKVDETAILFHFVAKIKHRDKSAMNAILAKAVEIAPAKGIKHIIYGRYTYGNKTSSSLADFKRRNAFEKVELPRYYIPLTLKGRLACAVGLHRGLLGLLPPRVISVMGVVRGYVLGLLSKGSSQVGASSDSADLRKSFAQKTESC